MGSEQAPETIKIFGPECLPRHLMTKKIGKNGMKYLTGVEKRLQRDIYRNPYPWIDTDQMFINQLAHVEELMDLDPRFAALYSHTGKVQQNVGVTVSTQYSRKVKDLMDPLDNELFMRCINLICDELLIGARRGIANGFMPRVTIKRNSGRGHGADFATGEDAARWTHEVMIPEMLASDRGVFHYMDDETFIALNCRLQLNSLSQKDGTYVGKQRVSLKFQDRKDKFVVGSLTHDGNDGFIGVRGRHVNAVSHTINIPLMVVNAIYMDTLTEQLKKIWKFDIPRLSEKFVGGAFHCIDFESFESTQPKALRHYVARRLYSDDVVRVTENVDNASIVGVHTDFPSGKEPHDYDVFYWLIDRANNPTIAEEFSPLLSGTGDTALLGKVLGTASQLMHLSNALDMAPEKIFVLDGGANTIAARSCANLGDDQGNGFRDIEAKQGWTKSERTKILDRHIDSIEQMNIFKNTLEINPGKIAGAVAWGKDLNDIHSDIEAFTLDPVTFAINSVFQEQDYTSPLRADPIFGLAERMKVYGETLIPYIGQEKFSFLAEKVLEIVGWEGDAPSLIKAGEQRAEEMLNDPALNEMATAQALAAQFLGLKNVGELDYVPTREEILTLPKELLTKLWISIDSKLLENPTRFISEK
jgi:hypothetical protein